MIEIQILFSFVNVLLSALKNYRQHIVYNRNQRLETVSLFSLISPSLISMYQKNSLKSVYIKFARDVCFRSKLLISEQTFFFHPTEGSGTFREKLLLFFILIIFPVTCFSSSKINTRIDYYFFSFEL